MGKLTGTNWYSADNPTNTQASEVEDFAKDVSEITLRQKIAAICYKDGLNRLTVDHLEVLFAAEKDRLIAELISKLPARIDKGKLKLNTPPEDYRRGYNEVVDQMHQVLLEYREAK